MLNYLSKYIIILAFPTILLIWKGTDGWNISLSKIIIRLSYAVDILVANNFEAPAARSSGGRLNKKDGLTRYGNSHVKDKTS